MMKYLITLSLVLFCLVSVLSSCKKNKEASATNNSVVEKPMKVKEQKKMAKSVVVDPLYRAKQAESFKLLESNINGDNLILLVQYGGGCETHQWELKTTGAYAKSMPPQITLNLEHNANGDMCRALLTDTLEFNVEKIRYNGSFELDIKILGYENQAVRYKY